MLYVSLQEVISVVIIVPDDGKGKQDVSAKDMFDVGCLVRTMLRNCLIHQANTRNNVSNQPN